MSDINVIFKNNAQWAEQVLKRDPEYFSARATSQAPQYLWIGCSDSRVSANLITGLKPGEIFVHRNIANLVVPGDLNCLSVIKYAVDVLKVRHIIVVGHYGCGGVYAALENQKHGLVDNWLKQIRDVRDKHSHVLNGLADQQTRWDKLCELNVIQQVQNVADSSIVSATWERKQEISVYGCIYNLNNGLLKDLGCQIDLPH